MHEVRVICHGLQYVMRKTKIHVNAPFLCSLEQGHIPIGNRQKHGRTPNPHRWSPPKVIPIYVEPRRITRHQITSSSTITITSCVSAGFNHERLLHPTLVVLPNHLLSRRRYCDFVVVYLCVGFGFEVSDVLFGKRMGGWTWLGNQRSRTGGLGSNPREISAQELKKCQNDVPSATQWLTEQDTKTASSSSVTCTAKSGREASSFGSPLRWKKWRRMGGTGRRRSGCCRGGCRGMRDGRRGEGNGKGRRKENVGGVERCRFGVWWGCERGGLFGCVRFGGNEDRMELSGGW
ncbi:protein TRANSPARENT TESTA GLABRA 1 [Senna tora]|uniref:Protein TRANSPARENT TESTA GLABRA 1 n=1 Tax=Senna tora TaxID=362788 RepID=A0A834T0E4_9FABA|nr:protein TRANSPARENT TESTA GLABRA 1 [Senna tora]